MSKKFFILLGLWTALMSSCASSYNATAPVFGYEGNSIKTNVTAELDMENAKKVFWTIEARTLFGFIELQKSGHQYLKSSNRYGHLTKLESQALYMAKYSNNADIILDPEFTCEKHSWFFGLYTTKTVTLNGWAVKVIRLNN